MEAAVPNLALNSWHPRMALLTAKRFLAALGEQVGRLILVFFVWLSTRSTLARSSNSRERR